MPLEQPAIMLRVPVGAIVVHEAFLGLEPPAFGAFPVMLDEGVDAVRRPDIMRRSFGSGYAR